MARNGTKTGGGSRKGKPNKTTKLLKDMILQALDGAGGVAYLQAQADASPNAFLALVGKVLPLQLTGDAESPVIIKQIERVIVEKAQH
jgi:hypothetical protein